MKECGKNFSQIYELKPGKIYKIFIDVEKLKKLSEYGPFDYVKKCYSDPNDFTLDTRFISENSDNLKLRLTMIGLKRDHAPESLTHPRL